MEKDKMIGQYVEIYHGDLFDKLLVFGTIKDVDAFDNVHLVIDRMFHKTFFHTPRWFSWNPFLAKREVVWYDYRGKDNDWKYKIGETITFPLRIDDWRLAHTITPSTLEKANKRTKKIDELNKIDGGWFGFP